MVVVLAKEVDEVVTWIVGIDEELTGICDIFLKTNF